VPFSLNIFNRLPFRKCYRKFHAAATNRYHQLVVNGILLALASYISLQKIAGFSVDPYLSWVMTPAAKSGFKVICIWGVVYASALKILFHFLDAFQPLDKIKQEPERINACLLNINKEIKRHLTEIEEDPDKAIPTFTKSHNFDVNVAHIVDCLANHMKQAFANIKPKNRDIFISVYEMKSSESDPDALGSLHYLAHWDPQRDTVFSMSIDLGQSKYKGYECVKAITQKQGTVSLLDCTKYKKSRNRGDIKHYVGMQLQHQEDTLGFLNIEFHYKQFFSDEAQMLDFVEKEILAFKYLIEYQFLKKRFFSVVSQQFN
jgi:hypothetical protein